MDYMVNDKWIRAIKDNDDAMDSLINEIEIIQKRAMVD